MNAFDLHTILWTKVYEWKYKECNGSQNIVYMFHSISDLATDPRKFISNKDGFSLFIEQELQFRKAIPLKKIVENSSVGGFAITFDDVFEDVYLNAYPLLKEWNIPFTLFVSPNLLDKPGYLTTSELIEMSKDENCTIGAHTMNHFRLRTCVNAQDEIVNSKIYLEQLLKREIIFFAYPYGSVYACSHRNIEQVQQAGFSLAFSTIKGYIPKNARKNVFFLPRNNGDHFVKILEEKKGY